MKKWARIPLSGNIYCGPNNCEHSRLNKSKEMGKKYIPSFIVYVVELTAVVFPANLAISERYFNINKLSWNVITVNFTVYLYLIQTSHPSLHCLSF